MVRKNLKGYEVIIDDDFFEAAVIGKNLYLFELHSIQDGRYIIENAYELISPTVSSKENLIEVLAELAEYIEYRNKNK